MIWEPSNKQFQAWEILQDKTTTEILYGGGAGGGKSYLGCVWILTNCLQYPGTRWLIGRASLKTLKETTLLTFFGVCKSWGLKSGEDYKYNSMTGLITFNEGSEVYLKDLYQYPADPEFDELGSSEFTGAFIDEASQITQKAYNIVMSRIRYRLDEFGLIPKILTATNPTKNFLYSEFYKPFKENKLKEYRKFVPALVSDNPFISKFYIENLNKVDEISKQRLLFGNWEYDDDPSKLFEYEKLLDMFTLLPQLKPDAPRYLTVDVARFGQDRTVIILWQGLWINKIFSYTQQSIRDTRLQIERLAHEYGIPRSQIVIDEDGIGGGLVDELKGVKGFVNNSRPFEKPQIPHQLIKHNYANLKSQCYFTLAEYVNNSKISIAEISPDIKKLIISDLEQIKRKDADKDGKLQVTPKEEIKANIGRSPDFGDAIMMRMLFEVKPKLKIYIPH